MRIVILDPDCPSSYCDTTLEERAMGGTEGTIVRLAEALGRAHEVYVAQPPRCASYRSADGVTYVPYDWKSTEPVAGEADAVILVRAYKLLKRVRRAYPHSRLFLWLHCFAGKARKDLNALAVEGQATIVTVSDTHRKQVVDFLDTYRGRDTVYSPPERARVCRIYNPIPDDLAPDATPVDPDKLVYFSSPHKGLDQVLTAFEAVRARRPSSRLFIANPGYIPLKDRPAGDGVEILGALPHAEVLRHVRSAFCVFYPQHRFEETFGLIFAEANAVGTPVIAHPIGSAREMLRDDRQIVDARDPANASARLAEWHRDGRPPVTVCEDFRLSSVVASWKTLLRETAPPLDEPAPPVEDAAPPIEERAPAVEDTPPIDHTAPGVEDADPPTEETIPDKEEGGENAAIDVPSTPAIAP